MIEMFMFRLAAREFRCFRPGHDTDKPMEIAQGKENVHRYACLLHMVMDA